MKDRPLPDELRGYVRKRVTARVSLCVLLLFVFGSLLWLFGDVVLNTTVTELKITFYILVMLVPFCVTGVPLKLIDRKYVGEVVRVDIDTVVTHDKSTAKAKPKTVNVLVLTIKRSDGKLMWEELPTLGRNPEHVESDYSVGDRVYKFYGLPKIFVVPRNDDGKVGCVVCGCENKVGENGCVCCGHALIDIKRYRRLSEAEKTVH